MKHLGGGYLRVGGTAADMLVFSPSLRVQQERSMPPDGGLCSNEQIKCGLLFSNNHIRLFSMSGNRCKIIVITFIFHDNEKPEKTKSKLRTIQYYRNKIYRCSSVCRRLLWYDEIKSDTHAQRSNNKKIGSRKTFISYMISNVCLKNFQIPKVKRWQGKKTKQRM